MAANAGLGVKDVGVGDERPRLGRDHSLAERGVPLRQSRLTQRVTCEAHKIREGGREGEREGERKREIEMVR